MAEESVFSNSHENLPTYTQVISLGQLQLPLLSTYYFDFPFEFLWHPLACILHVSAYQIMCVPPLHNNLGHYIPSQLLLTGPLINHPRGTGMNWFLPITVVVGQGGSIDKARSLFLLYCHYPLLQLTSVEQKGDEAQLGLISQKILNLKTM